MATAADSPRPGLRERKKARNRAMLQEAALRLFTTQGYDATTVEQIADAADVSPSTFFRYFPTKEDVVLYDVLDPLLLEAFRSQPAGLGPIPALRSAMRQVLGSTAEDELGRQTRRADLILSVPELRTRMLDEFVATMESFAAVVAERSGRTVDDIAVLAVAGAVIGVTIAAWLQGGRGMSADALLRMDQALAQLEAGLPV